MQIKILRNNFSEMSNCQVLAFEIYFEQNERSAIFETGVPEDFADLSEEELIAFIKENYTEEIESLEDSMGSLAPEPEVAIRKAQEK